MQDYDKTKEQIIAERDEERRQRQDLEARHTERQISDERYAFKWAEKMWIYVGLGCAIIVVTLVLGSAHLPIPSIPGL